MSDGTLEGLAASSSRAFAGFVIAQHSSPFGLFSDLTPSNISVNVFNSAKDCAKRDYIEGRVVCTLPARHSVTGFIPFEHSGSMDTVLYRF